MPDQWTLVTLPNGQERRRWYRVTVDGSSVTCRYGVLAGDPAAPDSFRGGAVRREQFSSPTTARRTAEQRVITKQRSRNPYVATERPGPLIGGLEGPSDEVLAAQFGGPPPQGQQPGPPPKRRRIRPAPPLGAGPAAAAAAAAAQPVPPPVLPPVQQPAAAPAAAAGPPAAKAEQPPAAKAEQPPAAKAEQPPAAKREVKVELKVKVQQPGPGSAGKLQAAAAAPAAAAAAAAAPAPAAAPPRPPRVPQHALPGWPQPFADPMDFDQHAEAYLTPAEAEADRLALERAAATQAGSRLPCNWQIRNVLAAITCCPPDAQGLTVGRSRLVAVAVPQGTPAVLLLSAKLGSEAEPQPWVDLLTEGGQVAQCVALSVNGQHLDTPQHGGHDELHGYRNHLNASTTEYSPVDATKALQGAGTMRLGVQFAQGQAAWRATVLVVAAEPVSVHALVEQVLRQPPLRVSGGSPTPAADRDQLEIQHPISFKDPLTLRRMVVPVRGRGCEHLQPFDLRSHLEQSLAVQRWACPVCSGPADYSALVLDHAVYDALFDADGERAVWVRDAGGGWQLELQEEQRGGARCDVIDLDGSEYGD